MSGDHRRTDGAPAANRDARRMRRRSTAHRVFGPMAAAGAEAYARARDLPRLIALWPHELEDESAEECRRVLAKLPRALRAERRRAASGHWSYDLKRHVALVGAYKAELARLDREEARLSALEPVAARS